MCSILVRIVLQDIHGYSGVDLMQTNRHSSSFSHNI